MLGFIIGNLTINGEFRYKDQIKKIEIRIIKLFYKIDQVGFNLSKI